MKCLSVREPWVWMILEGRKSVENRTWKTSYRGPLLIHASKTFLASEHAVLRLEGHPLPAPFPSHHLGYVVGIVDLLDCTTPKRAAAREETFAEGPWCWLLRNPRRLERPIEWRGELGLFDVDLPAWALGAAACT